jgi:hypothetical protein
MTPYIFDDIADYKETADAIWYWWNKSEAEQTAAGLLGREHYMKPEVGLSAFEMGNRFIKDINTMLEKWQPRKRTEIFKI